MKTKKKILAILIALTMFLGLIPFNIFAVPTDEQKANLVQIELGNSNDIELNGNTATISYDNGTVSVEAADIDIDKDENHKSSCSYH